jgi:exopolyphosphatase / guanosine-5'-triphosphate,3'-diphosphate pyrophosphatase
VKFACFDIGTNTVLMVAVEVNADHGPTVLCDLGRITRLGRGVDRTGMLDAEGAALTLDTVVEFAAQARAAGVERFVGAATSAVRDASNGANFLRTVRERAAVELQVISGSDEAALSHLAVMRGLTIDPAAKLLIVDIGGGSTELIRAQPKSPIDLVSLQIGSVRLTERILGNDPPSSVDTAKLRDVINAALSKVSRDFHPDVVVGIAGTVTTVCAISTRISGDNLHATHGRCMSLDEVRRVRDLLGEKTVAERRGITGIVEGRVDVIFAGAMILERVMEHFGARDVIVSDQGVRWGLVWREIDSLAR